MIYLAVKKKFGTANLLYVMLCCPCVALYSKELDYLALYSKGCNCPVLLTPGPCYMYYGTMVHYGSLSSSRQQGLVLLMPPSANRISTHYITILLIRSRRTQGDPRIPLVRRQPTKD